MVVLLGKHLSTLKKSEVNHESARVLEVWGGRKARRQALRGLIVEGLEKRHLMAEDVLAQHHAAPQHSTPYQAETQPADEVGLVHATQTVGDAVIGQKASDIHVASDTTVM